MGAARRRTRRAQLGVAGSGVGAAVLAACGGTPAAPDAGGASPSALKGTLRYRT